MTVQTLDPFGYWPAMRSRIRKLGGRDKADDPNYVFHTSYARIEPGPSIAEISFANLVAESGMIAVRIFQHLPGAIPAVTEHAKITALLPSVAKTGRAIKVRFDALPDATYAVVGYVFGECEASASAIDIAVGPRATSADDPTQIRSEFGRLKARHVANITSDEPATLAWPVSQGFSSDQTRERDYARLTADLPRDMPAMARWETAYIVRVLEQYGRLEPGARGIGISRASDPAESIALRAGCDVTSVVLAPDESIADGCARHWADPVNGRGFDFAWTRPDVFGAGGSARAIGLIEEMLERLRPGGLGVHLVTMGDEMDRHALNRIALGIAALGHIVAQIRYATEGGALPFGIVVRRATDEIIA